MDHTSANLWAQWIILRLLQMRIFSTFGGRPSEDTTIVPRKLVSEVRPRRNPHHCDLKVSTCQTKVLLPPVPTTVGSTLMVLAILTRGFTLGLRRNSGADRTHEILHSTYFLVLILTSLAAGNAWHSARQRWRANLKSLANGETKTGSGPESPGAGLQVYTTLPLSAEELHQTGLEHVAALEARAVELGKGLGLSGRDEVLAAIRDSAGKITPQEAVGRALAAVRRAEERGNLSSSPPPFRRPAT